MECNARTNLSQKRDFLDFGMDFAVFSGCFGVKFYVYFFLYSFSWLLSFCVFVLYNFFVMKFGLKVVKHVTNVIYAILI